MLQAHSGQQRVCPVLGHPGGCGQYPQVIPAGAARVGGGIEQRADGPGRAGQVRIGCPGDRRGAGVAFGAAVFSPLAQFAALVAVCTVASRLRGRALIAVAVLAAAASAVFPVVNPAAGEIVKVGFPAFLVTVVAFGWGLYLRARRDLVASLRERAERLEADQQHAAEQAREAERRRIAREMHDVLAHRLSLLSVHAGALESAPTPRPPRSPRPPR